MTDKQPEALRLAQCIDFPSVHLGHEAAAELRRLYASEDSLRDQNAYLDRKLAEREKVMQQALEALEKIIPDDSGHWPMQDTAITALREQLEGKK